MNAPAEDVWLGAFAGAQLLVLLFCVVKASTYRERGYMLHGAATLLSVLAMQAMMGVQSVLAYPVFLLLLGATGLQLLDLVNHAGGLRLPRRLLLLASTAAMPVAAVASVWTPWALLAGTVLWTVAVIVVLQRAWPQSQPWMRWLGPGFAALIAAGGGVAWEAATDYDVAVLTVSALLTTWSACVYIATGWRGRIMGETRARVRARNTTDPLTGLATPLVLAGRIDAARTLTRRYGHPSVLLLVHIENLPRIAGEFGPEAAEAAVLAAAIRVRQSLRDGDVAARIAHSRIAVLAEGLSTAEGAANVASRILVAGLKEPLPATPAEFLQFRIVQAAVPVDEVPARTVVHRLAARLEDELRKPSERRIVTLTQDELLPRTPEPAAPAAANA